MDELKAVELEIGYELNVFPFPFLRFPSRSVMSCVFFHMFFIHRLIKMVYVILTLKM